jgi:hypothetical protein
MKIRKNQAQVLAQVLKTPRLKRKQNRSRLILKDTKIRCKRRPRRSQETTLTHNGSSEATRYALAY